MREYIDKEALVIALDSRYTLLEEAYGGCDQYTMGFLEAVLRVENFRTADADLFRMDGAKMDEG